VSPRPEKPGKVQATLSDGFPSDEVTILTSLRAHAELTKKQLVLFVIATLITAELSKNEKITATPERSLFRFASEDFG
jgi:hypothetical protein